MTEVDALRAALESRDAQLSRQNAGLVQMAQERDALRADAARLQAELDALRAVIESGAGVAKDASGLLAKVIQGEYQWPSGVAWAVRETHRILTGGAPDGVYVRAKENAGRDLDAEVVAGVQAGRGGLRCLTGKVST